MTTTYVIDGYNLLHAMGILLGKVKPAALERARVRLQEFLVGVFGEQAEQVTVVFDAARPPRAVPREQVYKGLTLLLAVAPDEADDVIESLIAHHSSPRHLVVVSSDNRLQAAAHRKGAQALTCNAFIDFLDRRRQPNTASSPDTAEKRENLSKTEIAEWLREFAGLENEPDLKDAFERFDFEDE